MGTPETIQVFEEILSDQPAVEIHKFARKIRNGIAIYGNPIDIQINTVFIGYLPFRQVCATRVLTYQAQLFVPCVLVIGIPLNM